MVSIGGGDGGCGGKSASGKEESGIDRRLGNMRFRGVERGLPGEIVWGESIPRLSVDFAGRKPGRGRRVGAIGWFSSSGGDEGQTDGVNA